MATCDLFGHSYQCPDPTSWNHPYAGADLSAWQSWQIGDPTPAGVPATSSEGGQTPSVGDVVAIGGGVVGLILQIAQGIATVEAETGEVVEVPAQSLPVLPPPVPPEPMDWTPILLGGGLLLVVMMGMRR